MATNKHAIIRYRALDKCFRRKGGGFTINQLLEFCNNELCEFDPQANGIKKRQLYEDIRFMESDAGFEISLSKTKDGKEVYYQYEDLDFSINKSTKLHTEEAEQIKHTLMVLSRFKGMPQFEWISEITARLESSFGLEKGAESIIDFEQNKYLKGKNHITTFFEAILNKKVLNVNYQSFKSETANETVFHPYYLKEYNNRWFCFGMTTENKTNKITNLALDRVQEIQVTKLKYIPNKDVDFETYFEDVIGVTVIGETQNIVLKVDKKLWPYIETKPLHESQTERKASRTSDYAIISLKVKFNYELESLLLSHGEMLEVLEPLSLKKKLLERIKKIK